MTREERERLAIFCALVAQLAIPLWPSLVGLRLVREAQSERERLSTWWDPTW